ncbi:MULTISPECIES: DJ-1 family glyoxalase III [unclassified Clostridium]|uniref:DJ-1 family glyoxalase III n=1 Tax=Clostridium TaxID=1485 RepID=UPI001C8B4B7F|nr:MULTISPECIES: DJ-1 family glyoxalase III [unclassified Clostridium]MBX9137805.1 DJ-1/PfpI family protein [Clostridium sp. K12(2020)]MBX9143540.1 DJ-1/PfpI family protein [Clostridium sp. K13]MDU2290194.1 DJ-1/PfpI family protein [Clostridium celatum]MDU4324112.1 DJ-1/PfpI family protein [Clostridium celatum]
MKVAVLLAEGFETIEALTTVDILRRAGVACSTFGTKSLEVTTSHSVTIKADKVLNEEAYDYDVVVLPGGMPGSVNLRDDEKVNELVKKFYDEGKIVAAICAGPITLGKLGIVNGKNATCYPGFDDQLVGCNYKEELVVVDGNVITGRGPAAAIPFAFEILKHVAPDKVDQIKNAMLF